MPLSANSMPFNPPLDIVPFDAATCFCTNATFENKTATGYYGAPTQLDLGLGRVKGSWAVDISVMDQTTGDESYTLFLLGSNDVAWANGNVEILQAQNFGGTTGRSIATIIGASPAVPPVGPGATLNVVPFVNMKQRIVYRYVRLYLVAAGTTPIITLNSWLTYDPSAC